MPCREIASHVKEAFWEIVVEYSEKGGARCTFKWDRGHLFDHAAAVNFFEPCVVSPMATVVAVRHFCAACLHTWTIIRSPA